MLAHVGGVGARAVERQLARLGEQPVPRVGENAEHLGGQLAAQQADEGADATGAVRDDPSPTRLRERRDADRHLVELAAGHVGLHPSGPDRQVEHGAISQVGAAARQPVGEVGVAFQVVGPGLAPEGGGELSLAVGEHDRVSRALAPLQELRECPRALGLLLRDGYVRRVVVPAIGAVPGHRALLSHISAVARWRSRATMAISSASLSSVSSVSPPPVSTPAREPACPR